MSEAAELLQATLDEEKKTDEALTKLAESEITGDRRKPQLPVLPPANIKCYCE